MLFFIFLVAFVIWYSIQSHYYVSLQVEWYTKMFCMKWINKFQKIYITVLFALYFISLSDNFFILPKYNKNTTWQCYQCKFNFKKYIYFWKDIIEIFLHLTLKKINWKMTFQFFFKFHTNYYILNNLKIFVIILFFVNCTEII